VFTFLGGEFDGTIGFAGAALVRAIKNSKMLADDFFRIVPDDVLCGGIPANDPSRGVEHENCIIRNSLNKDLKLSFGIFECQFRLVKLKLQ
jgi:hypothetical protein